MDEDVLTIVFARCHVDSKLGFDWVDFCPPRDYDAKKTENTRTIEVGIGIACESHASSV